MDDYILDVVNKLNEAEMILTDKNYEAPELALLPDGAYTIN
jgi:hypothetical protein